MNKFKYLLSLIVSLTVMACERLETVKNVYPDMKTAKRSGAIQRGWVPAFLPISAEDIIEEHNIDTNEVWLSFSLPKNNIWINEKLCRTTELDKVSFPRRKSGAWWPIALIENTSRQRGENYVYLHCDNGGYIAVTKDRQGGYYWRTIR